MAEDISLMVLGKNRGAFIQAQNMLPHAGNVATSNSVGSCCHLNVYIFQVDPLGK